jgi:hypothetical protein
MPEETLAETESEQLPPTLESARAQVDPEPRTTSGADLEAAPEETPGDVMTSEELDEARANEVAYSWEASEYVHHHKGMGWYLGLLGLLAVLVAAAVLLKLWLTIGAFLVMALAIVVYARRPPRTLLYELSQKGIMIDGKEYPYAEFRSFGVLKDLEWHTIDLEPVRRFNPRMSILFDNDDFDAIVGHLELHLPRTDRNPDVIERLSRTLRF